MKKTKLKITICLQVIFLLVFIQGIYGQQTRRIKYLEGYQTSDYPKWPEDGEGCRNLPTNPEDNEKIIALDFGNGAMIFCQGHAELARDPGLSAMPFLTGKIPDGSVKMYYDGGALKAEFIYQNNMLNGFVKYYYENGVVSSESHYINNKLDGVRKHYYLNGVLEFQGVYEKGDRKGPHKYYYESGALKEENTCGADNMERGVKAYYESGALKFSHNCGNTAKTTFYENGVAESEMTYEKGIHTVMQYDETGLVRSKMITGEGIRTETKYHENGKVAEIIVTEPSVKHHINKLIKRKKYDQDGNLIYEDK